MNQSLISYIIVREIRNEQLESLPSLIQILTILLSEAQDVTPQLHSFSIWKEINIKLP